MWEVIIEIKGKSKVVCIRNEPMFTGCTRYTCLDRECMFCRGRKICEQCSESHMRCSGVVMGTRKQVAESDA